MKTLRLDPADRTKLITLAALKLAESCGYRNVSREQIAEAAQVSPALVSSRLGTMDQVRRAIMRAAVKAGNVRVVAQGLVYNDPHARKAPEKLRIEAGKFITG